MGARRGTLWRRMARRADQPAVCSAHTQPLFLFHSANHPPPTQVASLFASLTSSGGSNGGRGGGAAQVVCVSHNAAFQALCSRVVRLTRGPAGTRVADDGGGGGGEGGQGQGGRKKARIGGAARR